MLRLMKQYLSPKQWFRQVRDLCLLECQVHGSHYYACLDLLNDQQLDIGQQLILHREPRNEYDSNAIEVLTSTGEKLGYVPKSSNEVIATLIDQGCQVEARICAIVATAWEPVTIKITMR